MALDVISLRTLLDEYSEEEVKLIFDDFTSINSDVEYFLHNKAIQFQKIGISRTTLVFNTYKGKPVLSGYFAISSKSLTISKKNWSHLSRSVQKRLMPVGSKTEQNNYEVSSILLGQLGLNFKYHDLRLISGSELLNMAYIEVRKAYQLIGGTTLYLEAENEPRLREFYTKNGFRQILLKKSLETNKATVPYESPNGLHVYVKKLSDI